jgi:hypothetical protein
MLSSRTSEARSGTHNHRRQRLRPLVRRFSPTDSRGYGFPALSQERHRCFGLRQTPSVCARTRKRRSNPRRKKDVDWFAGARNDAEIEQPPPSSRTSEARSGTHNHRRQGCGRWCGGSDRQDSRGYGFLLSQERHRGFGCCFAKDLCLTGKSVDMLSSHVGKNILLSPSGKSLLELPRLVPTRGAFRERHGRWTWDAVDAAASARNRDRRAESNP